MAKISCFSFLLAAGNKKRSKVTSKVAYAKKATGNDCPKVKPVEYMEMAEAVDVSKRGGDAAARGTNAFVPTPTAAESSRQERDAKEGKASSDAGLVAGEDSPGYTSGDNSKNDVIVEPESSSVGRTSPPASPRLKRSCSNIEAARSFLVDEFDLPMKSRSYGDLKAMPSRRLLTTTPTGGAPDVSPTASVRTSCSADLLMPRKRSSRQVLPSRSRKLWWRLFVWSQRNVHRPGASSTTPALPPADTYGGASRRNDGYTSDTMDVATRGREPKNKEVAVEEGPSHPIHLVAVSSATSSLDRVSGWVNSLEKNGSFHVVDEEEDARDAGGAVRAWCSEIVECSTAAEKHGLAKRRAADETVQTSSIVHALNMASSVARISDMGFQAVPRIAAFSSLRAVNLSGNFIAHIHPGSLPKGLHSLDLSRNKIAIIEGLRKLTRLRVLNLSYNRISRIGHGLSSCTAIRELYLAGNKISDVEGLHRLLKLAVLDVSFNRITTAKSLGQLVVNYGSLRALNLLGNPVQANVGDDTLRRVVAGLLPRLEYLNKQAVKPQRTRDAAKDSVAQAALGNGGWGARSRRVARQVSQSPGSSGKSRGRDGGNSHRGSTTTRSRPKSRAQGPSVMSRR